MKSYCARRWRWARGPYGAALAAFMVLAFSGSRARPGSPMAVPGEIATRLPAGILPEIGCWFWRDQELAPEGYRPFLDLVHDHAAYTLLTTSLRLTHGEITDANIHAQIKKATAYARRRGMGIVMDLDVRLARAAFRQAYPDELQEMLRLRTVALRGTGEVQLKITSSDLSDHYTGHTTHYIPLAGRLVRVYCYRHGTHGIIPATLRRFSPTEYRIVRASAHEVSVAIPCNTQLDGYEACVMAAFTHLTPDVFAPHLLSFQRSIIQRYADAGLAGVCKDEWGFPPCFDGCPDKNDFWYSKYRAADYAQQTGGRDLVHDLLLMSVGMQGHAAERVAAINRFLEMARHRNGDIEHDFYLATKSVFGPHAVVATHPTWYPYPGTREFKKNGLDWWIATRDWAQTDEVTPFCARTSLAKKWNSPIWYNMYYATSVASYQHSIWTHALAGGRINFHPVYPRPAAAEGRGYQLLLRGALMRGNSRIRLLNFIAHSPLDCPVAVVFGHACAMNWAGPAYDDVGMQLTDALWRAGYPADLIPSSEIENHTLRVSKDGAIQFGPQRYSAVVLYHPEFEKETTATFFQRAANGPTALYRVGDWTADFNGQPCSGNARLPQGMTGSKDAMSCVASVIVHLQNAGVQQQTPATGSLTRFGRTSCSPGTTGHCRLIDGTRIQVAGSENVAGDPIRTTIRIGQYKVTVDAIGVVGLRLGADGAITALAAGGLRHLHTHGLDIRLSQRVDLAFWKDATGKTHGVLQDHAGPVPAALTHLLPEWERISTPVPLPQ